MSADNGIYIAKFPEGYRAAYGHNIENIDYFPAGSKERKAELKSYFDGSKILATREEAYIEAEISRRIFEGLAGHLFLYRGKERGEA